MTVEKYLILAWVAALVVRFLTLIPYFSGETSWIAVAAMSQFFFVSLAILGAAMVVVVGFKAFFTIGLK